MFSFHKSDALPRSRQSSVDSLATGPTTSIAASDLWVPPGSGHSHTGMHSPEQQHKLHLSKRSSVFNLRSRSNTATSTTPSLLSLNRSDMAEYDVPRHGSSPNIREFVSQGQGESFPAGARRSFFRGKKGKRLSETVTSSIGVVDNKEGDSGEKRMSVLRKGKKRNNQSEDLSPPELIRRISSPFDFQHLSHTDRHQFAALENPSSDRLAAVGASQPPSRGLTSAKAADLHFRNFSSDNLTSAEDLSASAPSFATPSYSLTVPHEQQEPECTPQVAATRPALRLARSLDSFSQPGVNPRVHHHSQSVVSPPPLSSRLPLAPHGAPETLHEEEELITHGASRSKRESGVWDCFALAAVKTPELPGIQEDSSYFGHALTTPDDSAIHAMTPPFSPSLADVAEEPERFVSPRTAPQPPSVTPTTPKSPHFESFSSSSPCSPMTRPRGREQYHPSPKSSSQRSSFARPISQGSETLGSSNLTRRSSVGRPSATRRKSNTWRAIEESWEDDVDYIYENALEADCDFEWDRPSDNDTYDSPVHGFEQANHGDPYPTTSQDAPMQAVVHESTVTQKRFSSGDFRTSLIVPSASSIPELVRASAISSSTTSTGLPTPIDPFNANRFDDEGFVLTPSLLIPQEYKDTREVTYEDLLDEYAGSDRHFPMIDASQSATSSARSSRIRSSRRSSYDSSLMSAQSSGLWSFPVRRSACSAGSVPELVPSHYAPFDQALSLHYLDEDRKDYDITPPGRTFFNAEEEPQKVENPRSSVESELRVSLELARRGAQRSDQSEIGDELRTSSDLARQDSQHSTRTAAGHHKQAHSYGTAKMLAAASGTADIQPAKTRRRAATTTAQARQPMLSLFPTPPRHTSTPNRF